MKVCLTKTAAIVLLSATALIFIVGISAYAAAPEEDSDLQISKIEKEIATQESVIKDPKTLKAKNHEALVMGAQEQIKILEAQKTSLLLDQVDEKAVGDADFNEVDFED